MSSLHPTLHGRPYAGAADLPALLALCPACRPAAWQTDFPGPTDLTELLALPEVAARTQVWLDAAGRTLAYALVDGYNNLWFDRTPDAAAYAPDDELVAWGVASAMRLAALAEIRRPSIPPAAPKIMPAAPCCSDTASVSRQCAPCNTRAF